MTTKPILDALGAARSSLQPLLLEPLPPQFGQTTVWMLQERLRALGKEQAGLIEECLHRGCDLTIEYLQRGGAPGRPESLYQGLCCHVLEGLLEAWWESQVAELLRMLEGDVGFESCQWEGDPRILAEVHRAIEQLAPPFIDFMTLYFSEALPEDVIRERLGLADHEEYLLLCRLSLTALRNEIERRLRA